MLKHLRSTSRGGARIRTTRLSLAALLALAGCAASTTAPGMADGGANAGLDTLTAEPRTAAGSAPVPAIADRLSTDTGSGSKIGAAPRLSLNEVFENARPVAKPVSKAAAQHSTRPSPVEAPASSVTPGPNNEPEMVTATPPAPEVKAAPTVAASTPPADARSAEARYDDAVREIRSRLASASSAPAPEFAAAVKLAVFDLLVPAAPDNAAPGKKLGDGPSLPHGQRTVADAIGSLLKEFVSGDPGVGEPNAAIEALDRAAAQMTRAQSVRIAKAALCTRVTGFGQYTPLNSARFQAGRAHRAIVYVELTNFAHRETRESDPGVTEQSGGSTDPMWAVEISQELGLWHSADGSLQWRRPEQTLTEVSRNRRRDFYLVQTIDLPATLSVGEYSLKILVRDRITNSVDESIVPITVVADAAVAAEK